MEAPDIFVHNRRRHSMRRRRRRRTSRRHHSRRRRRSRSMRLRQSSNRRRRLLRLRQSVRRRRRRLNGQAVGQQLDGLLQRGTATRRRSSLRSIRRLTRPSTLPSILPAGTPRTFYSSEGVEEDHFLALVVLAFFTFRAFLSHQPPLLFPFQSVKAVVPPAAPRPAPPRA